MFSREPPRSAAAGKYARVEIGMIQVSILANGFEKSVIGYLPNAVIDASISYTRELPIHLKTTAPIIMFNENCMNIEMIHNAIHINVEMYVMF